MKIIALSFLSFLLLSVTAGSQVCVSAEAENFYQKAMKEINPAHISWVNTTAAAIHSGKSKPDDLPELAGTYRHQTMIGAMDIEGLMILVMMEVYKDTEKDLRDLLDEMKKQNEEKKKIRDAINRLKQQQKEQKQLLREEYDSLRRLGGLAPVKLTTIQPKKVTAAEIKELLDSLRDKLDSMNEMGEMASLRLQMMMDRISKFMETLSNLTKKLSETADAIIKNLK